MLYDSCFLCLKRFAQSVTVTRDPCSPLMSWCSSSIYKASMVLWWPLCSPEPLLSHPSSLPRHCSDTLSSFCPSATGRQLEPPSSLGSFMGFLVTVWHWKVRKKCRGQEVLIHGAVTAWDKLGKMVSSVKDATGSVTQALLSHTRAKVTCLTDVHTQWPGAVAEPLNLWKEK